MSQNKREAREMRKRVAEKMKDFQPVRIVPSTRGLALVYALCACAGYLTGVFVFWWRH